MSELLRVRGLQVAATRTGTPILGGVDLEMRAGEVVGIVGESGSGKSTLLRAIARLLPDGLAVTAGEIALAGRDVMAGSPSQLHRRREGRVAMVFQDPATALSPVIRVGDQVAEAIRARTGAGRAAARGRAAELLGRLGFGDSERRMRDLPHQFSGGQRQRIVLAIALAGEPELLLADEPTSALDVSTQAEVLALLRAETIDRGTAVLFVSHDYAVLAELCPRTVLMYSGRVLESGPTEAMLGRSRHPYGRALVAALPDLDRRVDRLETIPGRAPLPGEMTHGCPFAPRCAHAQDRCVDVTPVLEEAEAGHTTACRRHAELWPTDAARASAGSAG